MARKIWTGSINFGLVTIPVGLYAATEDHGISFHQYERGTSDRVRYKRVNERTGEEVDYGDIVKGREVDGKLVTVEPKELDEIAPGRSRTIDITSFVDLDEIDPVYFQRTYWLAPNAKENQRPYDLLRRAMEQTNQVGIATFVLRGKEYLSAVRADETALALNTLFFADEIRDAGDIVGDIESAPSDKELQMAESVIESMTGDWQPEDYEDTYTARVEELVEGKARGIEPEPGEAPPQATNVTDLTEALRRSVDEARKGRGGDQAGKTRGGGTARNGHNKGRGKQRAEQDDLGELSKGELDGRAKELGVRGRSKMNRADLEAAVRDARNAPRQAS